MVSYRKYLLGFPLSGKSKRRYDYVDVRRVCGIQWFAAARFVGLLFVDSRNLWRVFSTGAELVVWTLGVPRTANCMGIGGFNALPDSTVLCGVIYRPTSCNEVASFPTYPSSKEEGFAVQTSLFFTYCQQFLLLNFWQFCVTRVWGEGGTRCSTESIRVPFLRGK